MLRTPASRAFHAPSSLFASATARNTIGLMRPARLQPLIRPMVASGQQMQEQQIRSESASAHAVSNPTLANIEKRWEQMPPQEQAELWMALRDRMTVDWNELTLQEKKASYWIAFGPHGPRALPDPNEHWQVARIVLYCLIASTVVFGAARYFARGPPSTMTQEWQEMTNEYLKAQKTEAITGISAPDYVGKGMVQSPPKGQRPGSTDDSA